MYRLKFERGLKHLLDLEGHVTQWATRSPYTLKTIPDPTVPDRFIVQASAKPIPAAPYSLLVGDALHNFRGCLDHLAYALAEKYTGTPLPGDIALDSEFPIFGDEDRHGTMGTGAARFQKNGVGRMIRGIDPAAQTIIEKLQPYRRGVDFRSHPLWMLHDLYNFDKHRLLLATAFHSGGAVLNPSRCVNANLLPPQLDVSGGFIDQDTVVVKYYARPVDPDHEMHVDFRPAVNMAFRCGSVADGKGVLDCIGEIYNYIRRDVLPPLERFI